MAVHTDSGPDVGERVAARVGRHRGVFVVASGEVTCGCGDRLNGWGEHDEHLADAVLDALGLEQVGWQDVNGLLFEEQATRLDVPVYVTRLAPLSEVDELLFALAHNHDVMAKMRTCEAIAIEALESIATVQGPPAALARRASKALEAIRAAADS